MKSLCVRIEDDLHRQIKRKIANRQISLHQYVIGLIELDLASDVLPKHATTERIDDATVLAWLKQRLGCHQ